MTKRCCESIGLEGDERIVIDNGSTKPFPKLKGWKVIRLPKNRGNIGGQNACFENASYDYVLFVSNDVVFLPDSICYLEMYGSLRQVMPEIHNQDGSIQTQLLTWSWPGYGHSYEFGYICPSIVYLMPKKLWKLAGGFDESLSSSHEDIDMGIRLRKLGFKEPFLMEGAKVIHLGNATLSSTLSNHRKVFHEARLKVVNKHYKGLDRSLRVSAINLIDSIGDFYHEKIRRTHIQ
ncbi:glycosyltransferase [Patescibacteria group bacterium]|nr:glycosyltransferase [Patescibacteria group bacterium]